MTPTYNGHSIGHWEGDTLVVDTVGLNGRLGWIGWDIRRANRCTFSSASISSTRRPYKSTLLLTTRKATRSRTAVLQFHARPDWDLMELICEDNVVFEDFEH